ncbi:MAG: hypothetical protein IT373_17850 [Polyangiaceae bacterium]|nr:hypothetical protein [Polyangiaceae bacterium]
MAPCSTRSTTRSSHGRAALAAAACLLAWAPTAQAQPGDAGAAASVTPSASLATSPSAPASTSGETEAEAALRRGQDAEVAAEPAAAVGHYRRVLELAPGSRLARRAERRLEWLEARGDDGYRPLAALMRTRADPALDADKLAHFEQELLGFAPGAVRREARAFVAEAYVRLGAHAAALAAYERWLAEPGLEPGEARRAERGRALELDALGRDGLAALTAADLAQSPEGRFLRARRLLRGGRIFAVATGLAFAAAVVLFQLWRGVSRAALRALLRPERLALACLVLVPPVLVVRAYERAYARAAVALALAGLVGLVTATLAGAAPAVRSASRARRGTLACVVLAAQLGLGFAALDTTGLAPELVAPWFVR